MKKLILFALLGIGSLAAMPAKAQVSLSINIGAQPQWGPRGYNHVDYYYLPDMECYYYVPTRKFIYFSGNTWIHSSSLPSRYRGYNLYNARKVVINSPRPYLHHTNYRTRYVGHSHYSRPVVVHHSRPRTVIVNRGHESHGNNHYSYHHDSHGHNSGSHGRGHH